jgi:MSHA pilin protein MshC
LLFKSILIDVMRGSSSNSGFTMVELITIIVLLGIISIVAVSNLNVNTFATASFDQELRAAIRFAQKFAIASGCDVEVDVDAATDSYALNLNEVVVAGTPASCLLPPGVNFNVPLPNPAGGNFAGAAPDGVDITAGLTFVYGADGSPSASGTITVDGQNIIVEPSGYVH